MSEYNCERPYDSLNNMAPEEWLFRQAAQTWRAERYLKDNWLASEVETRYGAGDRLLEQEVWDMPIVYW